jgi:calcineurin-like phosphoesterase family protein
LRGDRRAGERGHGDVTTFYTSDLHFGHLLVADIRGFDDPADHDATVAQRWRETVGADDEVWVLGDLSMAQSNVGVERVLAQIAELPGTKHLIPGNHDPVHPLHRRAHLWQRRYLQVFESVQAFAHQRIEGVDVLLSHFPYVADHSDPPRFLEYRLRDEGMWLLHGHTHQSERRSGEREIHVGLDGWDLRPASVEEIAALMG